MYNLLFVDVETLISYGGLFLLCLSIFCATGIFAAFWLPSGAILFTAGVIAAAGGIPQDIFTIILAFMISSIAGSISGYWLGAYIGPMLYKRKDSFFFKHSHLVAAQAFYGKYGKWAVSAGFFLPIIRSFSPLLAGIIRLNKTKFYVSVVAGSAAWVITHVGAGYFIGSRPELKPKLGYIVGAIICFVTIPLLIKIFRSVRTSRVQ